MKQLIIKCDQQYFCITDSNETANSQSDKNNIYGESESAEDSRNENYNEENEKCTNSSPTTSNSPDGISYIYDVPMYEDLNKNSTVVEITKYTQQIKESLSLQKGMILTICHQSILQFLKIIELPWAGMEVQSAQHRVR